MPRRCSTASRRRSTKGLAQLRDVPLLTVSAIDRQGHRHVLKVAFELRDAWSRRVPTGELNRWFEHAIEANPPPAPKGQRIKLRYITQVKSRPPSFVVFGNRTDELPDSYRRYLLNAMRRDLELGAVPLRLEFRGRSNPFDRGQALREILPFRAYPERWDHGRDDRRLRSAIDRRGSQTSSTGCISRRAGPSSARASSES